MSKDYSKYTDYQLSIGALNRSSTVLSADIVSSLVNDCYVVSSYDEIPVFSDCVPGDVAIITSIVGENNTALARKLFYCDSSGWQALSGCNSSKDIYFDNDLSIVGDWLSVDGILDGSVIQSKGKPLDWLLSSLPTFIDKNTSKVTIDSNPTVVDLSIYKVTNAQFADRVLDDEHAISSNEMFIIEDDYIDCYGQQIKNISAGTDSLDAVNVKQMNASVAAVRSELEAHKNDKSNPHDVTPQQISAVALSGSMMTGSLSIQNDIAQVFLSTSNSTATYGVDKIIANQNELSFPSQSGTFATKEYVDDLVDIAHVTYSELSTLRANGGLKSGKQYRIIDYVATTNGSMESQSANHQFDIIVMADDERTINEHARAIMHDGNLPDDIINGETRTKYFANCQLAAWGVWYCFDNDATRFEWAKSDGKGVIYRLVDEYGNDCPYDFKGIQFNVDDEWRYTFGNDDYTDISRDGGAQFNVIKPFIDDDGYQKLNKIVFKGMCYSNAFDNDCHENTFNENAFYNSFGRQCYDNVFGSECQSNSFGNHFHTNEFGAEFQNNIFGNSCSIIKAGDGFKHNTVQSNCRQIKFYGPGATLKNHISDINIESGSFNLVFNLYGSSSEASPWRYVTIKSGIKRNGELEMIHDSTNGGQTYNTVFQPANSQVISV